MINQKSEKYRIVCGKSADRHQFSLRVVHKGNDGMDVRSDTVQLVLEKHEKV